MEERIKEKLFKHTNPQQNDTTSRSSYSDSRKVANKNCSYSRLDDMDARIAQKMKNATTQSTKPSARNEIPTHDKLTSCIDDQVSYGFSSLINNEEEKEQRVEVEQSQVFSESKGDNDHPECTVSSIQTELVTIITDRNMSESSKEELQNEHTRNETKSNAWDVLLDEWEEMFKELPNDDDEYHEYNYDILLKKKLMGMDQSWEKGSFDPLHSYQQKSIFSNPTTSAQALHVNTAHINESSDTQTLDKSFDPQNETYQMPQPIETTEAIGCEASIITSDQLSKINSSSHNLREPRALYVLSQARNNNISHQSHHEGTNPELHPDDFRKDGYIDAHVQFADDDLYKHDNMYQEESLISLLWKCGKATWFGTLIVLSFVAAGICFYVLGTNHYTTCDKYDLDCEVPTPPLDTSLYYQLVRDSLLSVSSETVLDDPSTPQSQAMNWLVYTDQMSTSLLSTLQSSFQSNIIQRYALLALFFSQNNWRDRFDITWADPTSHECDWGFVQCFTSLEPLNQTAFSHQESNEKGGLRRLGNVENSVQYPRRIVTHLLLKYTFMQGNLLNEIGLLKNLVNIDLSQNNLQGPLPESLFGLTSLEEFRIDSNNLDSDIPINLSMLKQMKILHMDDCNLQGTIPTSFKNLTDLESIRLNSNSLKGDILDLVANMSNLRELDVSHNHFSGFVTETISNLSNLEYLDMSNNKYEGSLSAEIGSLSALQYISFDYNPINSQLPSSVGNLVNLVGMRFNNCNLEGPIPSTIVQLTNLKYLSFSHNNLTGSIPTNIGNLTSLKQLVLFDNKLNNTIPDSLSLLSDLGEIYIHNNNFTGVIHEDICTLRDVKETLKVFEADCDEDGVQSSGYVDCSCCTTCH